LHLDLWGPAALNYQCDIHRTTIVGGPPTAEQEHYLEGSIELIHHLIRLVSPGMPFRGLHAAAEAWLIENGFRGDDSALARQFGNYGHSLGLVVEAPLVIPGEDAVIEENMVLAIEGSPGKGAHFEHIVLVNRDGAEILTGLEHVAERPWADAA